MAAIDGRLMRQAIKANVGVFGCYFMSLSGPFGHRLVLRHGPRPRFAGIKHDRSVDSDGNIEAC